MTDKKLSGACSGPRIDWPTYWYWPAVSAIMALAAVARFATLGRESIWLDEGYTAEFIGYSWRTLWLTAFDNTPPLYYSIVKFIASPSSPEWLLRLPSAVAGTLWIPVIMATAHEVGGRRSAIWAGAFGAISAVMIYYSQEARAYAAQSMLTAVVIYATVRLLTQQSRFSMSLLALYAIPLLLSLYTHLVAAFAWMISCMAVTAWLVLRPHARAKAFAAFVVVNVLVLILWSPWLYLQLFTPRAQTFDWLAQLSPTAAVRIWLSQHSDVPGWTGSFAAPLKLVAPAAIALGAMIAIRMRSLAGIYLVAIFVGGPVFLYLFGFYRPLFSGRAIVWTATASSVLFGLSVSRLQLRPLALTLAASALLLSAAALVADDGYRKEDWRSAYRILVNTAKPGDDILLVFPTDDVALRYYDRTSAASLFSRYNVMELQDDRTGNQWRANPAGALKSATVMKNDYDWVVVSKRAAKSKTRQDLRQRLIDADISRYVLQGNVIIFHMADRPLPE